MKKVKGFLNDEDDLYENNSFADEEEEEISNSQNESKAKINTSKLSYKEKMSSMKSRIKSEESSINTKLNDFNKHSNQNNSKNEIGKNLIANNSLKNKSYEKKILDNNNPNKISINQSSVNLSYEDQDESKNLGNQNLSNSRSNINALSKQGINIGKSRSSISKQVNNEEDNDSDFERGIKESLLVHNSNLSNQANFNYSNMGNYIKTPNDSSKIDYKNNSSINNNNIASNNPSHSNYNLLNSHSNSNSNSTQISLKSEIKNASNRNINNNGNNNNYIDINSNIYNKKIDDFQNENSYFTNSESGIPLNESQFNEAFTKFSVFDDESISDIIPNSMKKLEHKIDTPYSYQVKIFEEIKNRNSIVFMETGKGKTFISIMLIKYLLDKEINKKKSKNSFMQNKYLKIETPGKAYSVGDSKQGARSKILQMVQQKKFENLNKNTIGDDSNINIKLKVIFLVCEVVLVDQQSKVIEQNLDDCFKNKVAVMNSSKKFSRVTANAESFRKYWDSHMIFVSTPSIVYKLLSIGYINIDQIDLIIFDECHHADGNHPYNILMNEFYFFHKERNDTTKLPQILGLTASPLKKKIDKDVISTGKKALENLCDNLDSVMVIDPDVLEFEQLTKSEEDDIKMLSDNEARRLYTEIVNHKQVFSYNQLRDFILEKLLYPLYNYAYEQEFYLNEEDMSTKDLYKIYIDKKFDSDNLTEYNKTLSQMKDLYEYRKKHYLFAILEKLQRQIFMLVENLNFDSIKDLILKYNEMFINQKSIIEGNYPNPPQQINNNLEEGQISNKLNIENIENIIKIFTNFLNSAKKSKIEYTSQRLTNLLFDIENIINTDTEDNDHRIIIFVSNRVVSEILSELINKFLNEKFNENFDENEFNINFNSGNNMNRNNQRLQITPGSNKSRKFYKSVSVVGVNKRKNESAFNPSNSINKMNENVSKFKDGKAQILVGTSTVEEGIDVRSCDFVIVYTELKTAKSYIQMKGRARKVGAIFSIYTNNTRKMQETISEFVELIIFIRNQFNKYSIVSDFRTNSQEKRFMLSEEEGEFFFIQNSKAKVTIRNSSILFNEFLQSLQLLDKTAKQIALYEEKKMRNLNNCPSYWNCEFKLQSNLIETFEFSSGYKTDKATSLASCYVLLFLYLYEIGKLDDSFKYKK